jgi:hypothetical protein
MSWLRENLGSSSLEIQVYTYLALYLICRCRTTKCSERKMDEVQRGNSKQ